MGLRIIIPGATFTHHIGVLSYPITDALTSLYYLGVDEDASVVNHAPDGAAAAVVGSVTYDANYGIFAGEGTSNHIQTDETDETPDATFVGIWRIPNPNVNSGRQIFSCYNGNQAGASVVHNSMFQQSGGGVNAAVSFAGAGFSETDFHFRTGVIDGTDLHTYTAHGGVVTLDNTGSLTRGLQSTRPLRIGGDYYVAGGAAYNDTAHIAMVSKHGVALTVEQLQAIYDYLTERYAKRGLTVV
jgi:hypothetical protein